jgi:hypothetical protein
VLERVSPLAVPVLCMIGREMPAGAADDDLLLEAEGLAACRGDEGQSGNKKGAFSAPSLVRTELAY